MIPTIDVFAEWRAEVDAQARNVKPEEEDLTEGLLTVSRVVGRPRYYEAMTKAQLDMETSCTSLDSFFSYADEELTLAPTYISFDNSWDLESVVSNDAASTDGQASPTAPTVPASGRRPMPDWMTVRGDDKPMTKTVGEKVYSWCDHHNHWCEHTTEECRAKNRSTSPYFSKSFRGCRGGKNRGRKNRMNTSSRSLGSLRK